MDIDNEPRRGPAPWRGFNAAIEVCFAKYSTFRGRASRSEFWFFWLFGILLNIAGEIADSLTRLRLMEDVGLFATVVSLALLVPSLAVASRRMHDAGWSFWWYLMVFVPVVGWIFLIYVFVTRDPLPNRFDSAR